MTVPDGWPPTHPRRGPGPILAGITAVTATAVVLGLFVGILAVGWWLA